MSFLRYIGELFLNKEEVRSVKQEEKSRMSLYEKAAAEAYEKGGYKGLVEFEDEFERLCEETEDSQNP